MVIEPSEITVITAYTAAMAAVGELAAASWGSYAAHHGYRFFNPSIDGLEDGRHPSWTKLRLLRSVAEAGQYAVWADADSAIVNPSITIQDILAEHPKDVLVGQDPYGLCCAHIIVRPKFWTHRMLAYWWALGSVERDQRPQPDDKLEQDSLKLLVLAFPDVSKHVGMLTKRHICQSGIPDSGHWAIHVSGGDTSHQVRRLKAHGWKTT